jgi:cyclic beta-1,2-glucan synthetase
MSLAFDELSAPDSTTPPATPLFDAASSGPIRAELFSLERLEAHARRVARACALAARRRASSPLLARFADNGRSLIACHERILGRTDDPERRGLDVEWLVDNFHIVEDVLREVRQDLPPGYDELLPKLAGGPLGGYPRVYALALELVVHTDGELDEARIGRFVAAFQEVAPLTIGELWAVPTMLRLVLLENLRRLAEQMLASWHERRLAEAWFSAVEGQARAWSPHLPPMCADDHAPFHCLTDPFVVRLMQLLRDRGTPIASALEKLETELGRRGDELNEVLLREHRRQAANQISIGNGVIGLRLISALDWNAFFERHSAVEAVLRGDPGGAYRRQDFATRDRQRRSVERIARGSGADEVAVARRAVGFASAAAAAGAAPAHVGQYLIDRGQDQLEQSFGYRPELRERLLRWAADHPRILYFGALGGALGLVETAALRTLVTPTNGGLGLRILAGLVLLLPLSELVVGLVNQLLTLCLPPRVLPKLDFTEGIPHECATFVVIPSMLIWRQSAATLLERLEIHYLANPDPELRFALLTDFADGLAEHAPEDETYLAAALEGVKALNDRYAAGGAQKFYLFHRRRQWNPAQDRWMGWERKRGKLVEFNRLLRGARDTSYCCVSGDLSELPRIRFVITLDADTQLPRESAQRLVGTLAHPLNQPHLDPDGCRVVEGYGLLQPRVSYLLTAATRSRFAALLASSAGIDPYATAVSDHYMDLFGAGSFTGKGIYDVDAFQAATGRTFPENHILSHDLVEGNYARCGLATDIELFDDFPTRYHAYARREHRWVRGDWQLLPWLFPRVPGPDGQRPNPLPALERWKLADNLRRSLIPPSLLLLLVVAWTILPGSAQQWTALVVVLVALPVWQWMLATAVSALRGRKLSPFRGWLDALGPTCGQVLLTLVFLADQARLMVDAIARTLRRLFISRRNLLEWETAASTEVRLGADLASVWISMWPSAALAAALGALLAIARPESSAAAAPVLALWMIAPFVAFWVSRPRRVVEPVLNDAERRELRMITRKTWHFFETFVGEDDHWLPPDNIQEFGHERRVAHRTSPTNQGLLLVSTLAAHDLGYISLRTLVERLEQTFATLERLERHEGHFLNWYDTETLAALPPAYISTVDSGNLLGCLLTLKQGLRQKLEETPYGPRIGHGLADTLALAAGTLGSLGDLSGPETAAIANALGEELDRLDGLLAKTPSDLPGYEAWLGQLDWATLGLLGRIRALGDLVGERASEIEAWTRRFASQVREHRTELAQLAPWLETLRAWDGASDGRWQSDEAARRWRSLRVALEAPTGLTAGVARSAGMRTDLEALAEAGPQTARLRALAATQEPAAGTELFDRLSRLAERADALASSFDFRFLYKPDRHLFSIGKNLAQGRLDSASYDLLASEAALSSFLAVARGDAPRRHWFQLGRPYIRAAGRIGLLSWGGTMFEYLMPRLMLRSPLHTLLAEACHTAIDRQIEFGRQLGIPWGMSESAFAATYLDGDYQYQAFGVPGLGLKRGLDQDRVVAPYATALAAMVRPREAIDNFRRLAREGADGAFGFYEAVDYTAGRLPEGERRVVVRSYMAHHQGMSLVALANALLDAPMPRRFHAEPMVRSAELLLQERVPRDPPIEKPAAALAAPAKEAKEEFPLLSRRLSTPATPVPRTHLLSNTQYHVFVTNAGGGASTWRGMDVTRWREDTTRDAWGQFIYVRDVARGVVWSAGHQPTCRPSDSYEVTFSADLASFRRRDAGIETLLEIVVSPERLAECRRLTLVNHDNVPRHLDVTSYAEVVLGPRGADVAHPAFNKLFLETEFVPGPDAILCRRRPRSREQQPVWAVHVSAIDAADGSPVEYETDRARFIGRGRSPGRPAALDRGSQLSGTTGPVLDPIMSLRRSLRIEPGASAIVSFTTGVADTRDQALTLADHFRTNSAVTRAFEMAWAQSQVEHRHRNWSPEDAQLYQRLAGPLFYTGTSQRAAPELLAANRRGQSGLWGYGISGDRPILLSLFENDAQIALARKLLLAHSFLRLRGLEFDLVLLDLAATNYRDDLHQGLLELVRSSEAHDLADKPGGLFVRKAGQMPEADLILLQTVARVVLNASEGSLAEHLDRLERGGPFPPGLEPTTEPGAEVIGPLPPADRLFWNGHGGFTRDGREYWIDVHPREGEASTDLALPPTPWINVVANPACGFLISEAGSGYTWTGNSQLNRLTAWNNDPVCDAPAEVIYVRDEETGQVWSPTPAPFFSSAPVRVRHGQGYTVFERSSHGLDHSLLLLVPVDDPIKLMRLEIRNTADRPRRLSITLYAEWVLGQFREAAPLFVVTEADGPTGALLARNAYRSDFAERVAFADVNRRPRVLTADRGEFLGRNGSTGAPAALERVGLSGRVGAGLDPCAAIQVPVELEPGETTTVVYCLGEAENIEAARALLRTWTLPGRVEEAWHAVQARWDQVLGTIQVRTPNPAMDLMLNRWLLYQSLACRVWGRSAFYQSGGAFGFRDQLQDVMALCHGAPADTRAQILRAASRQFIEGDVQHWWHPPAGRGVRTRFSDDFLWLPLVVHHYVSTTGDIGMLDESVPFLEFPMLEPEQEELYGLPSVSARTASIYEHCVLAIEHGMRYGAHGLPLMGTGDWNDGMNRVGAAGTGESIWDAWFQITIFRRFSELAERRGDAERVQRFQKVADDLAAAVEAHAWDGEWYRRAYFDDGMPLGSAQNDECQIDSIAQSWALISGAGEPARALRALAAVDQRLVRPDDAMILLFTPPFDQGPLEPGYIKGYVPGIRENGGQYTHAATWVVLAHALAGNGGRAVELFDMLNPVRHTSTPAGVARYKVEPYVVVADVYGHPPHVGRGGWTWYTGSASWLYRVGLEAILGFRRRGAELLVNPCIPADWPEYELSYKYGSASYRIVVENPDRVQRGIRAVILDGRPLEGGVIPLADDGRGHEVRIRMGD